MVVTGSNEGSAEKFFITADCPLRWCDSVYYSDELPAGSGGGRFGAGDVVFCKIDEVLRFFERVRLTRRRVILVTGQGDLPCDAFRQGFLPSNVVRWFATNVTHLHPRVTAIPLGLGPVEDNATLREVDLRNLSERESARDSWLYVNFRPDTNPNVRQRVFDYFQSLSAESDWVTFAPASPRGANGAFAQELLRHRFVLCPEGNGVDTHRMWETLAAGAIPVVRRSTAMEPFASLPILLVDDLCTVSLELLEREWRKHQETTPDLSLLFEEHWRGLVRSAKAELEGQSLMPWSEWLRETATYGYAMGKRRIAAAA